MKRYIVLLLTLTTLCPIRAQHWGATTHALALWAKAGYNRFDNTLSETHTQGGWGFDIGVGYEFGHDPEGFLLQTGLSISPRSSTTFYTSELNEIKNMLDTEGNPYLGYFNFHDIHEKDVYVNISCNLLLGYEWRNRVHIICGPKFAYALYGEGITDCLVTTSARYDGIIGEDGNGLLTNMPNHHMKTTPRSITQPIYRNPYVGGIIEIGYSLFEKHTITHQLIKRARRDFHNSLRISAFCEYGCYINTHDASTQPFVIDQITDKGYEPLVGNFLYNGQKAITSLSCGLKLTYLIHHKDYPCMCEGIDWF